MDGKKKKISGPTGHTVRRVIINEMVDVEYPPCSLNSAVA